MFAEGVAIPGPPGPAPVLEAAVVGEEGVLLKEVEEVGLLFLHRDGNQYKESGYSGRSTQ